MHFKIYVDTSGDWREAPRWQRRGVLRLAITLVLGGLFVSGEGA